MPQVKKGATDQTVYLHLRIDSSGKSKTGLLYNSAGAVASYIRSRGTRTAISLATLAAADSAHSDGGFKEVDGTNAKGLYRLDVPDAAFASGVDEVIIHIGFTDVFEESLAIELVDERPGNLKANAIGASEFSQAAADKVRASVCVTGDPANSIGKLLFANLNAPVGSIPTNPTLQTVWTNAKAAFLDATISSRSSHATPDLSALALEASLNDIKGTGFEKDAHSLPQCLTATGFATENPPSQNLADYKANVSALALASVCTEERLAELDAANIPADVDRILIATEIRQVTVNDEAATTTKFITDLTETDNTFWDRAAILFTSGNNKGLIRAVKNYNGSTKEIQIQTPLIYAPANNDKFIIVIARKFLTPDIGDMALESTLTAIKGSGWTDETLKAIKDVIDTIGGEVGPGALSCTWAQKDNDENPMDNVQIWITTDEAGVNVIAGTLLTNAQGKATFMLDAGTYYVWREKGGKNFTNPQTWSVS